jgi:hypothetical protein
LRRAFGDPLYVKTSRGMEPTPRADSLVAPTLDALKRLNRDVFADVSVSAGNHGRYLYTCPLRRRGNGIPTEDPRRLTKLAPRASIRSVTPPLAELEQGLNAAISILRSVTFRT